MRARSLTIASLATSVAILASLVASPVLGGGRVPAAGRAATGGHPALTVPRQTCSLSGSDRTCDLWAKTGSITLPGLGLTTTWGYAATELGEATLPGPAIVAKQGETLHVVLHNGLAEPSSLSFPGQDGLVSDTVGAAAAGTKTYDVVLNHAGTFLYQAGLTSDGPRQVALGLFGALVVRPTTDPDTSAYGDAGSRFDTEQLIVASEIDPALNAAPLAFNMRDYHPRYWLFNGKAYPDTGADALAAPPASRLLLRYVNAGLGNQSLRLLGAYQTVVATGGHQLAFPYEVMAETIPAGSTLDAIAAVPDAEGSKIAIMSASGHYDNAGALTNPSDPSSTVAFGGMLAFIDVQTPVVVLSTGPKIKRLALSTVSATSSVGIGITATAASASAASTAAGDPASAEWFVDGSCLNGAGAPMAILGRDVAGTTFRASVKLALTRGAHLILAHARDAAGHWGACEAARVDIVAPAVPADAVSVLDFETGSVSGIAGDATIAAIAGLDGTARGLLAPLGGRPTYVSDGAPNKLTKYRARFWFDPNGSSGGIHTIFQGRSTHNARLFAIQVRRAGTGYLIRLVVDRAGGVSVTRWVRITDSAHAVELAWKAGSAGQVTLIVDGTVAGSLRNLHLRGQRLDSVRLGPSAGVAGARGSEYFDEFVSTRGSTVGP